MKPPVDRLMLGQARAEVAELRASLATATAVLKRAGNALNVMLDQLATRNQTSIRGSAVAREVYAFLGNQPAEPARYDTAAQSTSELMARIHEVPARTEAERRVLEALYEVPDGTLRWLLADGLSSSLEMLAGAELARRAVSK